MRIITRARIKGKENWIDGYYLENEDGRAFIIPELSIRCVEDVSDRAADKEITAYGFEVEPETAYMPDLLEKETLIISADVETNILSELGQYAVRFAENHGITASEAMRHPTVKAYAVALERKRDIGG